MKLYNLFILFALGLILTNCGSGNGTKKSNFSLHIDNKNNTFQIGEITKVSLSNVKNKPIDKVQYTLDGQSIDSSFSLSEGSFGEKVLEATIVSDGETEKVTKTLTFLPKKAPKLYTYKVINEFPHDKKSFVQGLEFHNDTLYEGTGKRGASVLKKLNHIDGTVYQKVDLEAKYFGEGITILNDKLYQLTWQAKKGFVYDPISLEKQSSFAYGKSKEGWGLCNDGKILYKSDGTEKIWTLDPETLAETGSIKVYTNRRKLKKINELEYANGKIYANTWQFRKEVAVIINPKTGAVEGVIDFKGLKRRLNSSRNADVLNGIAYNPKTKTFFVTGKYWDKLFEVEIIEK